MTRVPITYRLPVRDVPAGGKNFRLEADAAERRALAESLGIVDVESMTAEVHVKPMHVQGYEVRGTISAIVVQTDVVTLDTLRQEVSGPIEMILAPAEEADRRTGREAEAIDAEGPDLFHAGTIDLGAIAAEHLALALDPYPRAAGVEFEGYREDEQDQLSSPFAALGRLKRD
jgi:hypothetical protein